MEGGGHEALPHARNNPQYPNYPNSAPPHPFGKGGGWSQSWGHKGSEEGKNGKGSWGHGQDPNALETELPPGRWNRREKHIRKQERDAAAASSLLAADGDDSAAQAASVANFLEASRHLGRTSKELRFQLDAQALVTLKASELKEKAAAARPLAEQVASLEIALSAKVAEAERLKSILSETHANLDGVWAEGHALEQRLSEAKARMVGAHSNSEHVACQQETESAIRTAAGLCELLPPGDLEGFKLAN